MKALVTGSYGLVGSYAKEFLKEKGIEVIGLDNNMRSVFFGVGVGHGDLNTDIRDYKELEKVFAEHNFDLIVHTAAQPSHDWASDYPLVDFGINALGTLNLLELTRKYYSEAVFIHVSTNKVYGDVPNSYRYKKFKKRYGVVHGMVKYGSYDGFNEIYTVDQCMHSLFGCSKLAADIYAQEYGKYFEMKTGVFRLGCITGKNHKGAEQHGFLSYLMKCAKEKKPYTIYGYKGKQVRDNIHAWDLVNAFWHYYQNPKKGEVYNLGGGPDRSVSVLEAVKKCQDLTGNKMNISFSDKARKGDHIWYVTDCSKFKNDYPEWDYKYSLDDIFNDLL
jgi:CDP-paratose 2-epimerase